MLKGLWCMDILNRDVIESFVSRYPDSASALAYWFDLTHQVCWKNSVELKQTFAKANVVSPDLWIFNIGDNKYRLAATVLIAAQQVFVHDVMTHAEYEKRKY